MSSVPRFKSPWLVVFGSALALTVGNGPIMQFTFGVFLKPLTTEFGVDRGTASFALMVGLLATAAALPLAGRLADAIGPRRLAFSAVVLLSASLAALGLLPSSIWSFMALFGIAGVAASGQTPLPYMRIVAGLFDRHRGAALALSLIGVGIGSMLLPVFAQRMIDQFGWRGGYVGLAALLLIIALPALFIFVPAAVAKADALPVGAVPGLSAREAMRTVRFWLLMSGLFLAAGAANGTIAHVVPLLTDRGIPTPQAVAALALVGASSIVGRLIGGVLLDRVWAPAVSLIFLAGVTIGMAILAFQPSAGSAKVATCLLGLGLGVEADLVGFLLSRYFGLKAFATLFGWVFASFLLASSLGPILMGVMFDATGDYTRCLLIFIVTTFVAAILFLSMGRYAYPTVRD